MFIVNFTDNCLMHTKQVNENSRHLVEIIKVVTKK